MESITRGYLESPAGRSGPGADAKLQIHYRVGGSGGIPLLLLHQSPISSVQFEAVLPGLVAAGFHAAALDMPGFGMSDALPEPGSLDGYASIIPSALRHFGWTQAALVGHHTGAVVAGWFAAAEPRRVARLVLNGFPLLTDAERAHFATFYFGPKEPLEDGSHLQRAWQNRLRSTPGWTDLRLMQRYTVEGMLRSETNWKAFPIILGTDLSSLLRSLEVPTLLLTNTGEDLYEATRRARDLRPTFFRYAELVGGSHDIIDEQPDNWLREVVAFLK